MVPGQEGGPWAGAAVEALVGKAAAPGREDCEGCCSMDGLWGV